VQTGMSLIEVLVAITLLGLLIVGILFMHEQLNVQVRRIYAAVRSAQQAMRTAARPHICTARSDRADTWVYTPAPVPSLWWSTIREARVRACR